mgnify:CR=1 FL=1
MSREELIKKLTSKDLAKAVYLSQLLFFVLSIILWLIFIRDFHTMKQLFQLNFDDIFYYGVLIALVLVVVEIIMGKLIPKKYFDDGGINEKLFKGQAVPGIFSIALVVAICEELLFRGVIQTVFGYIFASSLFVIFHTRYLKKPLLLLMVIITSFLIGYLFEVTNNILVTITFHFVVDFVLGLYIKYSK